MNAADRLANAVARTNNPTALGLDTLRSHLPADFTPFSESVRDVCEAVEAFNIALLDELHDIIGCVKVQAACYECYGVEGMKVFSNTLSAARTRGYVTIADAKRGDIGSTAQSYAKAFLDSSSDFAADFVTVNPYFGIDGILPFVQACAQYEAGVFILVKTSNPSGEQLQGLDCTGTFLYERVADLVSEWGSTLVGDCGYSSIGAVVGATWPNQHSELRKRMPFTPFLVPGYGAQGAAGSDLAGCFDQNGGGAIVNASRSLLTAHQKSDTTDWLAAVRAEAVRMKEDLAANCRL
jgi:orotidine-5'-phosphate decarboxylase